MKTMMRLSLALAVALILTTSASVLITHADTVARGVQQHRALVATQIAPATAAVTTSATLDEIDPGKPGLSVGTPVDNVVFAAQKTESLNDNNETATANDGADSANATSVGPAGAALEQAQPADPTNGNPLYDTPAPGSDPAVVAAQAAAQLAADASGEKPALSSGTAVADVVYTAQAPKSGSERAALQEALQADAEEISVWYGSSQNFGHIGEPQAQINVLGTVLTPTGPISAAFTLNGGATQPLSLGPDKRRLAEEHDFNVEIPYGELVTGTNTIVVTATDHLSKTVSRTIKVDYDPGNMWPTNYVADWGSGSVQSIAQVVDGQWSNSGGVLRPLVLNYDRLVAIGDIDWRDYEVTVPFTIHAIDQEGFRRPSNGPGVGLLLRWQGHYQQANEQPTTGWQNFGAIGWFRWSRIESGAIIAGEQMLAYGGREIATNPAKTPSFEVPYLMKMSVQSSPNANRDSYYRFKVWRANEPEPLTWDMESFGRAGEPLTGSLLLVAHHVDVSFGDVTVRPLADITSTITTATDNNGVVLVEPEKDGYAYGEPVEILATGNSGFAFNEWHGDIQSTENPLTLLVTEDISLTASFVVPEPAVVTPTVQGDGSIIVSPAKDKYEFDERVTLTAVPKNGSVFTGWSGAFSGQSNPVSLKIRNDLAVTASFAQGVAAPISDDFRSCKLGNIWTTKDPKGDSTFTMTGEQLRIEVPANSDHDLFENKNFAPRILQNVPNGDFIIEVRFESKVAARFQIQGIIVEQDDNNFMRMEFFHDGVDTHVFAAYMLNGELTANKNKIITVPADGDLYMRVGRSGNTWTQDYSFDGATWVNNANFDHTITVARAGVYGGNADPSVGDPDTSPAYTAIVDYFFNTASRIAPEDGAPLAPQVTIVGQGQVTLSPNKTNYGCDEAITLTATPTEGSIFSNWGGAATGSTTPLVGFTLRQGSAVTATFAKEGEETMKIYLPVVQR